MKYKILRFNEDRNLFELEDPEGRIHRVDLFVSGSHSGFGQTRKLKIDSWRKKMNSFLGMFVEVGRLHPYEEIANDVKLLK